MSSIRVKIENEEFDWPILQAHDFCAGAFSRKDDKYGDQYCLVGRITHTKQQLSNKQLLVSYISSYFTNHNINMMMLEFNDRSADRLDTVATLWNEMGEAIKV